MKAQSELMGDHKSCTEMMWPCTRRVTILDGYYRRNYAKIIAVSINDFAIFIRISKNTYY